MRRLAASVFAALAAATALGACGTDAVGVDACKQIEEARCRNASSACGVPIDTPKHTTGTDVDACIRHYDVACLHGLEVPDPGPKAVRDCVAAINASPCPEGGNNLVANPELDPACAWLVPPAAPPASADASDAPAEASDAPAQ